MYMTTHFLQRDVCPGCGKCRQCGQYVRPQYVRPRDWHITSGGTYAPGTYTTWSTTQQQGHSGKEECYPLSLP